MTQRAMEPSGSPMAARARLIWLAVLLASLLALYWPTAVSIVAIWIRSETFAHGFLVLPIVGFLIWRKRATLDAIPFRADPLATPILLISGLVWLIARLTEILVVEQLALVAAIAGVVWLVLGRRATRLLAFPLGFMLFAVPMGEGLVYPLMQFTAVFTVSLLRLTGVPVFSDGTFFSLPSGDWAVVEACSGLRYLIASVFLGVLYAYLSYRALWRRLLFIGLATVVPILANGLRAYLIVMLGHLSNMKLAVGIDHLIYGWVFFGLVMLLLFAIGNLWAEPVTSGQEVGALAPAAKPVKPESARSAQIVFLSCLLLLALWPALGYNLGRSQPSVAEVRFEIPNGHGHWQTMAEALTVWTPHYVGAMATHRQVFQRGTDQVGLHLAFYSGESGELVNSQNVMITQHDALWRMPDRRVISVRIGGLDARVIEAELQSDHQRLLTWHWYWIDGHRAVSDSLAKLYEALALLTGNGHRQVGVVIYTPIELKVEPARERLRGFLNELLPAIETGIEGALDEPRGE